jgi:hypothetical protein
MIDSRLIQQCSESIQCAIDLRQATEFDSVYRVKNVLDPDMIIKLKNYIDSVSSDRWQTVPGQEHNNRRAIVWQADTVIEELHEAFARATSAINVLFGSQSLNFIGIQLWTDGEGYDTGLHQDNETIDVSCQVYLFDQDPSLGTSFVRGDQRVAIPYINNTGYLMINNRDSRLLHGTSQATPAGVTRYSAYAVWSRSGKK